MKIAFDPAKDATNIAKHGLSLLAAERFDWETALEREDDRFDYGEVRFVAIGRVMTVCMCSSSPKAPTKTRFARSASARRKNTR